MTEQEANALVEKWRAKGWQVSIQHIPSRDSEDRFVCEMSETVHDLMPHGYLCGEGPTVVDAVADAKRRLALPEPYPTVAERYHLPVNKR